jgi:hypothetical protein
VVQILLRLICDFIGIGKTMEVYISEERDAALCKALYENPLPRGLPFSPLLTGGVIKLHSTKSDRRNHVHIPCVLGHKSFEVSPLN